MLNEFLWTAIITPFTPDGWSIDYASLKECLLFQERAGNGIVLLGSTGESLSLTKQEKISILQLSSELSLKVPVLCGVPNHNFFSALEWLKICRDFAIQGFLVSTPIYTKPGIKGQTKWFEALLETSTCPMMLYNIPSRTGVELYPAVVHAIKDHEFFYAIKDASGVESSLTSYFSVAPNISIYSGDDDMMPALALKGAKGLVSVASNVWGQGMRRYVQACLSQDFTGIDMPLWKTIFHALKQSVNPIAIKALLNDLKKIGSDRVRLPLSQEDGLFRTLLLEKYNLMTKEELLHECP